MRRCDLAIIGSGPGGYVAALYAASHKLKVCLIEKNELGGTCLNRGCIPTKSMLYAANLFSQTLQSSRFGIEAPSCSLNFEKVISRRDEVVSRLRAGIGTLLKARGVEFIKGEAGFIGPSALSVSGEEIVCANIIIAAGSVPSYDRLFKVDETSILTSDGMLNIRELPRSLAIVGGGVIGCEFASLYNLMGVKVTVIETADRILPSFSPISPPTKEIPLTALVE